jgi:hypothetical protein
LKLTSSWSNHLSTIAPTGDEALNTWAFWGTFQIQTILSVYLETLKMCLSLKGSLIKYLLNECIDGWVGDKSGMAYFFH